MRKPGALLAVRSGVEALYPLSGFQLAKIFKDHFQGVPIVFGGIGATFLNDHLLRHFPWIDIIVRGEGEITFPALIHRIEAKKILRRLTRSDAQGRQHHSEKQGCETHRGLDVLPMPAAHYTFHHLAVSRGCPVKCTFCGSPKFWGPKVRFHSAGYFVGQLEILFKKGHRFFHFSDDTFTLRKKLVLEICALIVERELDITWAAISTIKALEYATDARAYWGLGLLAQVEGDDRKAEAMLREGIQMFPDDAILARVLNNTLMRLG